MPLNVFVCDLHMIKVEPVEEAPPVTPDSEPAPKQLCSPVEKKAKRQMRKKSGKGAGGKTTPLASWAWELGPQQAYVQVGLRSLFHSL